ncbi:MAG: tetratricopeptide repeat protein [Verrucomicrobiae bacterium]|nr:tetratricopeptide repeat protein [Verrucomicrobiae bacterium]
MPYITSIGRWGRRAGRPATKRASVNGVLGGRPGGLGLRSSQGVESPESPETLRRWLHPAGGLVFGLIVCGLVAAGCGRTGGPEAPVSTSPAAVVEPGDAATEAAADEPGDAGIVPLPLDLLGADDVSGEIAEAEDLARAGRLAEAEVAYAALISQVVDNEEVHFNFAHLLARLGRTNEAMAHYEIAIELLPTYAEAHNNLGNLLVKQRRFDEAIAHFEKAIRVNDRDSVTYNNLGTALAGAGRVPDAVPQFAHAARLNPDYVEAWFNLGRSALTLGRLDDAIPALETAVRLRPDLTPGVRALEQARRLKQARGY